MDNQCLVLNSKILSSRSCNYNSIIYGAVPKGQEIVLTPQYNVRATISDSTYCGVNYTKSAFWTPPYIRIDVEPNKKDGAFRFRPFLLNICIYIHAPQRKAM